VVAATIGAVCVAMLDSGTTEKLNQSLGTTAKPRER
jgi:hypothetical protein